MIVQKSYKVRLYPTESQEQELLRILAGCRFVWNHFREKMEEVRLATGDTPHYYSFCQEIKTLRKTAPELRGIQREPIDQSLKRLGLAYRRFHSNKGGSPRAKHEEDNMSSFQKHQDWKLTNGRVFVQRGLILKTRGRDCGGNRGEEEKRAVHRLERSPRRHRYQNH